MSHFSKCSPPSMAALVGCTVSSPVSGITTGAVWQAARERMRSRMNRPLRVRNFVHIFPPIINMAVFSFAKQVGIGQGSAAQAEIKKFNCIVLIW